MTKQTLYKRDKTGKKILVYNIWVEALKPDDDHQEVLFLQNNYAVRKETGQLDGKLIPHIDIITVGKQSRSVQEQAEFVMQSDINKKKDEGYKSFDDLGDEAKMYGFNNGTFNALDKFLPKDRTDASGTLKMMKCTATNDTKTGKLLPNVLKKIVYPCDGQTKLDGVRGFIFFDGNTWRAISSSGKPYDVMARYILEEVRVLEHRKVITRDMILDGEFYKHGVPLQRISGWARKQTMIPEHEQLEFHVFDLPNGEQWADRRNRLDLMFTLATPPVKLKLVHSHIVESIEDAENLHNELVEEGYEGLILRNFKGKYQYGIRSSDIFKMKNFQDAEFEITGGILGKRGTFDMVFYLQTAEDKQFKAKPLGDAAQKEQYWEDLPKLKGKMATVRYLTLSEDGIPVGHPVLKVIRDYE